MFTHHSLEPVTVYVTWEGDLKIGRLPWIIQVAQCHHEGSRTWRRELDKGQETKSGSTRRIWPRVAGFAEGEKGPGVT